MFPAYSGVKSNKEESCTEWLNNASFKPEVNDALQEAGKLQITQEHKKKRRHASDDSDTESSQEVKEIKHKKKKKEGKKKKRKDKKHKKQNKDITDDKNERFEKDALPNTTDKTFLDDFLGKSPDFAFRIDRKSDKNNLHYDGLYKLKIAHHQLAMVTCLGQNHGQYIVLKHKHRKTGKKKGSERYYGNKNVPIINQSSVDLFKERKTAFISEPFIAIETRNITTSTNPLGIYDKATEAYIQGKSMTHGTIQDEMSDITNTIETTEEVILRKSTEYNKKLRENPSDVKTWLEFVKFQDSTIPKEALLCKPSEQQKRQKRALFLHEKKVAILERAIVNNPGDLELKIAQLDLCVDLWDSSKLHSEWTKLIFVHLNNTKLWRHYLCFLQSHYSSFSYSKVLAEYEKCIKTLRSIACGEMKSHKTPPNMEQDMIDIFYQMCSYVKQCGHTERAIAYTQALIEFNLFCPQYLTDLTHDDKVNVFEAFWDSGVARFGESKSEGWMKWFDNKGSQFPEPMQYLEEESKTEDEIVSKNLDRHKTWIEIEKLRESNHWLPWRPDLTKDETEESCEDPDRLVLFDDIASCLFTIADEDTRFHLVLYMCKFIYNTESAREKGQFSHLFMNNSAILCSDMKNLAVMNTNFSSDIFEQFMTNIISQSRQVLDSGQHTQVIVTYVNHQMSKTNRTNVKTWKSEIKLVKKYTKNILKAEENRNNVVLWDKYAQIEIILGNLNDARKVFDTILQTNGDRLMNSVQSIPIWRHYAELELGLCCHDVVVNSCHESKSKQRSSINQTKVSTILSNLAATIAKSHDISQDDNVPGRSTSVSDSLTASQILKTRKMFQTTLNKSFENAKMSDSLKKNDYIVLKDGIVGYALFQYVCEGLQACTTVFETFLNQMKELMKPFSSEFLQTDNGIECEQKYICQTLNELHEETNMAYLNFLQFHLTNHVTSLGTLRNPLQRALETHPNNIQLLKMFIDIEARSNIAGRVRRYFDHNLAQCTTPIPWLMAIVAEVKRSEQLQIQGVSDFGVTYRLRSMFERATEHRTTQHCPLVWRMFLHFEVKQGDNQQAVGIFYRGIQQCPWAKGLYTDGIQHFPEKLQEIIDLMTEKDIRVHTPLEEVDLLLEDITNRLITTVSNENTYS